MSTPSIPGHLYTPVMQLVNDHGYSVEDAIAKAAADAARKRSAPRRATEAPEAASRAIAKDSTPQKANTGALTIRVNDWLPPTVKQGGGANAHAHWRTKHRVEKNGHQTGRDAALPYVGWQCPNHPVLIAVIHWKNKSRVKDSDNALNSVKHLIDGICRTIGIDDKRFVTSMAFQRIDKNKNGFVDIIIRPATREERQLSS